MAVLLKIASGRVSFIQIMQVRVQNKGKSVWNSRYAGDVSLLDNNVFTHRNTYAFLREATSETYGPWVSFPLY